MSEGTKAVPTTVEAEAAAILWWLAAARNKRLAADWLDGAGVDVLEGRGLVRRIPVRPPPELWSLIELTDSGWQQLLDWGLLDPNFANLPAQIHEMENLTRTLLLAVREMPESVRSEILAHVKSMAMMGGKIAVVAAQQASATAGEQAGLEGAL